MVNVYPQIIEEELDSNDCIIERDGGFTTLSIVVALTLVLSLLLCAVQVGWVLRESPDIQFVADSAALAAENVMSQYYVISRLADSVILSMSLLSLTIMGISIVLCCIPLTISAGTQLMGVAKTLINARNKFSSSATTALNNLQKALPFLCAANASAVIAANSDAQNKTIVGTAIPVPLSGNAVELSDEDSLEESLDSMEQSNYDLAQNITEAQEALEKMETAKQEAFYQDCGANPDNCLYERASKLSGLSSSENPYYASVDLWSFSVPLQRAKSYYAQRLSIESPENSTLEEQVRSACRVAYYSFAVEELKQGYVSYDENGYFSAYFPLLPKNTSEMKSTTLYTDNRWPVSSDGTIHGVETCPSSLSFGVTSYGSLSDLDDGVYKECSECDFNSTDMGRVGSASSSIDNGFEYHYRIIAEKAEDYEEASKEYLELTQQAQESAQSSLDTFDETLSTLGESTGRYNPMPPGRFGCIAIALDLETHDSIFQIPYPFASTQAQITPRIAISAATLVKEEPVDGQNVISSLMDGIIDEAQDSGDFSAWAESGLDWILSLWSSALDFYGRGVNAIVDGVEDVLNSIPAIGDSPLGSWVSSGLMSILETVGLYPVDLSTPRPVVVNTIHVLRHADGNIAEVVEKARGFLELGEEDERLTIEGLFGIDIGIELPDFGSIDLKDILGEISSVAESLR